MSTIDVDLLDEPDPEIVGRVTDIVNGVYATSEDGLWRDNTARTSPEQMADLVAAGEIAAAHVGGELAGTIRVHEVAEGTGEFGLLGTDPAHQGLGVGRALIDFAERQCRERGLRTMQLELLVPRAGKHPSKVFLDAWYQRLGYRPARTTRMEVAYPELAPLLATPCELVVYAKPLA